MSHCHRATKSGLSALGPLPYAGWRGDQSLTLLTNSQGGSLWPHDQPSNVAHGRTPLFRCPSCPLELPASSIKEVPRGGKPCDTPVLLWLLGSWGSETLCSQLVTGEQPLRIRTEIPGPHTHILLPFCFLPGPFSSLCADVCSLTSISLLVLFPGRAWPAPGCCLSLGNMRDFFYVSPKSSEQPS